MTFVEGHVPDHLEELGDRQFDFVYTRLLLSGLAEPETAVEGVKQLVRCWIGRPALLPRHTIDYHVFPRDLNFDQAGARLRRSNESFIFVSRSCGRAAASL